MIIFRHQIYHASSKHFGMNRDIGAESDLYNDPVTNL